MDINSFLEIEQKYNLYNDKIDGINYWIYSRFLIWNEVLLRSKMNLATAHNLPKKTLSSAASTGFQLIKNSLSVKKIPPQPIDICFMNHSRRVKIDNYYECIYTDALAQIYSNSVVLEHPYQLTHLTPVFTKNLIYIDDIALKGNLFSIAYQKFCKKEYLKLLTKIEEKIKEPIEELEKIYALSINLRQVCRLIAKQILIYKGKYPGFKKLISKINPKLLIEVVHYDMDCMIVNEICREMNIPTIELQHGMMSDHIAYQYAADKEIAQFPQKVFLFSEYWKKCIRLPISNENIIATGFPYFEKRLQCTKKPTIYNDNKINILFISQGTIGKQLSELAISLSTKLDQTKYRIIFKLHPGEIAVWKELYSALQDSAVQVIENTDYTLYDYFLISNIQVGVYSTALNEGMGFGLHTFIYRIEAAECMRKLCESNYAVYVKDAQELSENIQNIVPNHTQTTNFWELNALENMQKEINHYLKANALEGH